MCSKDSGGRKGARGKEVCPKGATAKLRGRRGAAPPLRRTISHGGEGRPSAGRFGHFKVRSWTRRLLREISPLLYVATVICVRTSVRANQHVCGLGPAHRLSCLTSATAVTFFNS